VVVVTLATPFFKLLKPSKTANVVIACLLATIVVLLSVALFFWTRSLKLKGPKNRHKNTKIEMDTHSISLDVMNPVVPALQVVSNVPGAQAVPGAQTVPARIFADESYASMECPFDPDNGGRPTGGAKVRVGADNSAFLTVGDGGFFAERNEVRMVAPVAARAFTKEVLTARRTELEQIEGMPVTREVSVANETVSLRSADRRKLKEDARAEFDRRMPTTQSSANIRINQQGITLDGQMVELG
ncbi:MAG: hypothetical protein KDD47_22580, partial [Acidobacteria bacterium]|nr:hypothetical protein [Acidobacteriota bacterium]